MLDLAMNIHQSLHRGGTPHQEAPLDLGQQVIGVSEMTFMMFTSVALRCYFCSSRDFADDNLTDCLLIHGAPKQRPSPATWQRHTLQVVPPG